MPASQVKFEILAVVITSLGKFIFYDLLNQRLIFIVIMFLFWSLYLIQKIKKSPETLKHWGFRIDNFKEVLSMVLPFGMISIIGCFVIGFSQNSIFIHWHFIPIFLLYPLFGILQQFLLMSLFAGNLQDQNKLSKSTIILLTSTLFGLLHYPYWWLVIGTFFLSMFYSYIFLRKRNVYVLGLFHGWLGAIFYYTVVDQDPFMEVFGPLLK
ncbi:type II CAAX prenyl endopeptidase Rce1 family protein [Ekhidna sp.]|uniref:CPBP family glutamic-type intramembrane protease n=1 Tax=Ekhidna sp. TaxID=2608089 RepID=UPI003B50E9D7